MFKRIYHTLVCEMIGSKDTLPTLNLVKNNNPKTKYSFRISFDVGMVEIAKSTPIVVEYKCAKCGIVLGTQDRSNVVTTCYKADPVKEFDFINFLIFIDDTFDIKEINILLQQLFDTATEKFIYGWKKQAARAMNMNEIELDVLLGLNREHTSAMIKMAQHLSQEINIY